MTTTHTAVQIPDAAVQVALDEFNKTRRFMTSDKDRMHDAITAIIPHIIDQSFTLIEFKKAEKARNLKQNRRYKKLLRRCSQLNNAFIKAKDAKPVDVAAVRKAINSINIHDEASSYEWRGDGDYTPNEQEKALLEDFGNGLVGAIEDVIRTLSDEPAQGDYSVADELRDLQQSILQSKTLADFNAVKKTVERLPVAPTSEAGR